MIRLKSSIRLLRYSRFLLKFRLGFRKHVAVTASYSLKEFIREVYQSLRGLKVVFDKAAVAECCHNYCIAGCSSRKLLVSWINLGRRHCN
jgi:hypothetical protein